MVQFIRCLPSCLCAPNIHQYERAGVNFASLDILIHAVADLQNSNEIDIPSMFEPRFNKVTLFYSSPDNYTLSKYKETNVRMLTPNDSSENVASTTQHQVKTDDFFPFPEQSFKPHTHYHNLHCCLLTPPNFLCKNLALVT